MDFSEAQQRVMQLKTAPSRDVKLQIYGLFKQATVGDINTKRPGMFQMKERLKWDSWKSFEGRSSEDAEQEYVKLVESLVSND